MKSNEQPNMGILKNDAQTYMVTSIDVYGNFHRFTVTFSDEEMDAYEKGADPSVEDILKRCPSGFRLANTIEVWKRVGFIKKLKVKK